jgi:hypothetical protein
MAELGPGLLRQGVLVKTADLTDLLAERAPELGPGCKSITLDGKPMDIGLLEGSTELAGKDRVFLTVARSPVST